MPPSAWWPPRTRIPWGSLSGKGEEEHHLRVTWEETGEVGCDLLKGSDPRVVELGTERWTPGSRAPGEAHVS